MNDIELWEAAWWSAVAEPADPCARVLRQALGDRDARAWLIGSWSAPPSSLACHSRIDWRAQWNRWRREHPRWTDDGPHAEPLAGRQGTTAP